MSSGRRTVSSPPRAARLAQRWVQRFASAGALLLAGCSIDSALTPPADIGAVGSITPVHASLPSQPGVPVRPAQADEASALARAASASPEPSAYPAEHASTRVPVRESDRVAQDETRDPVVAGVGTGAPRLVAGNALGDPETEKTMPLLPETARKPVAAPVGGRETQVAFNVRPEDPVYLGQGAAPKSQANRPEGMTASEMACRRELRQLGVQYVDLPRISDGPACGIAYPIRLTGLSGGIRIKPAATLNCQVTAEFAKWVKRDVAPAARRRYLSGISSITQLSSYACRTMNSQPGAPMSEHARGNAIDIGSITLNSGRRIDVRKPGWFAFRQRGFLNTIRAESCGYFDTVLGPGSNKYHRNHFHFDLRQRKSGRSYCE